MSKPTDKTAARVATTPTARQQRAIAVSHHTAADLLAPAVTQRNGGAI